MRTPALTLMTPREAAASLRVSLTTLTVIERCGHIEPYHTPGGHRRYSQQMLEEYLQESKRFNRGKPVPNSGSNSPSLSVGGKA